jgi:hypothetical protein
MKRIQSVKQARRKKTAPPRKGEKPYSRYAAKRAPEAPQ